MSALNVKGTAVEQYEFYPIQLCRNTLNVKSSNFASIDMQRQ